VDDETLAFAGLAAQAELIRAGEVDPRELVELCLRRIEALDPALGAFRIVFAERALLDAEQARGRLGLGAEEERPLLGVPVAIKDSVDVAGATTTHGTAAHGEAAQADAEVVRRLRAAGAIVIGKTRLPELQLWPFTESATFGVTRNPWNLDRTPGGSSGGSSAAVAAGLVGAAHASDGAGSIRLPAAACGLFGLKPQRGRVSTLPEVDAWHGLAHSGVLTRGVLDTAVYLDAVSDRGPGAPPLPERPFAEAAGTDPRPLRVALSLKPPAPTRITPVVRRAVEDTAELLRSLGHEVHEHDPDYGAVGVSVTSRVLRGTHDEAAHLPRPERLERRTQRIAALGGLISPKMIARVRAGEAAHAARLGGLFEDHDVLLTPTMPAPPQVVGAHEGRGALATLVAVGTGVAVFTGAWNATGQPAASVPAGFTADGLPLAVQFVGRRNDEATLIALAGQLERARPWGDRRPPLG